MQPIPSGERVEVKYLLGKRNADLLVTGELILERGFYLDLIKLKFLFKSFDVIHARPTAIETIGSR